MFQNQKKRIILAILQQLLALILALVMGTLYLNSIIVVDNMYGERIQYRISPFDTAGGYTNSVIFNEMLQNAISDIARFAVIKEQLETDGSFDSKKHISVTEFVNRKNPGSAQSNCPVSAVYELEKLIKWGMYGLEMQTVTFQSKFDFITYFGYENLISTIEDEKAYEDFDIVAPTAEEWENAMINASSNQVFEREEIEFDFLEEQMAYEKMEAYLNLVGGEDAVYQAIREKLEQLGCILTETERGSQKVISLSMLDNRYETITDQTLKSCCKNWEDYYMLEQNVIETVESLNNNYTQYLKQNDNYAYGKTNVLFYLEVVLPDGRRQNYTNMGAGFAEMTDAERMNSIRGLGKFLYYSPGDMNYTTNTGITEKEMLRKMESYDYALSEDTRMWIGVYEDFPIMTDIIAQARDAYDQVISNVWFILLILGGCILAWLSILVYISCYTGIKKRQDSPEYYLYILDRIPLEFFLAGIAAVSVGAVRGFRIVQERVLENSYFQYEYRQIMQAGLSKRYLILMISTGVLFLSLFYSMAWYSFIRRWHSHRLWTDSGMQKALQKAGPVMRRLLKGKSALLYTLMPYNMFILYNAWSILYLYRHIGDRDVVYYLLAILFFLIDVTTGWWLYQRKVERMEILEGAEKIGQGDLEFEVDTALLHGDNISLGEAVNHVGEGIRKSVAQSLKDERMKTDLITNVSHDIKTPLTSIINYVNLLKRQNITQEPVRGYIQVLDVKSQRLKQLTDDLVEASRISSGNIILNMEKLNLKELVYQSLGEFSEKFEEKELTTVFEEEGCADIYADSRRMWRIVENLLNNVYKYAMKGTRVYIRVAEEETDVLMELKNISENPLNFKPDELTERFIRGDISRSTEGSGLGLSIVKGLAEVQKGSFQLELDGDLFKASVRMAKYTEP